MKTWMNYIALAFMATTLTLVSCGDDDLPDDPPSVENSAPTLSLMNSSGNTLDTINITDQDALNTFLAVSITADDADDNLSYISFERDGILLGASETSVRPDSVTGILSSNRTLVDSTGFTRTFFFRIPSDFDDLTTYEIIVADSEGEITSEFLTITTPVEIVTTPITSNVSAVLFSNQAGPAGTGGVDLDNGIGVGSMATSAELRDLGIDTGQPAATNWRRQIAPVNGTILRAPAASWVNENPFANVETVEAVVEGFNSSTVNIGESNVVTPGSIFIVNSPSQNRYYLVEVVNVIQTANDNTDRYVINVKY